MLLDVFRFQLLYRHSQKTNISKYVTIPCDMYIKMVGTHALIFDYLLCEVISGNFNNLVAIQKRIQFYDLHNVNIIYSYFILWPVISKLLYESVFQLV